MKRALYLAALLCAVTEVSMLRVSAQQPQTARDGVYTAAQATRGAALYQMRCLACHGPKLEGDLGPPLAGTNFLGTWGPQTLSDLFDKIHDTMPYDAPGTLTDAQVADVVSYLLQSNQLPAGRAELAGGAALKQIAMDPVRRQDVQGVQDPVRGA